MLKGKMRENALQFNMHKYNHLSCTAKIIHLAQRNHHAFKQAFLQHVHFHLINSKYTIADVKYTRLLIL